MTTHISRFATLDEARVALARIQEHPVCEDPTRWAYREAWDNTELGWEVICFDPLEPIVRLEWAKVARDEL